MVQQSLIKLLAAAGIGSRRQLTAIIKRGGVKVNGQAVESYIHPVDAQKDSVTMDGKPVVRGTRIPVEQVLRMLGAGMSPEAILVDHPRLTLDDIRAAQAFAADYLADEDIVYG